MGKEGGKEGKGQKIKNGKSGKTKCSGPIKRNVIFSSKTKCNKIKNAHSTKEVDLKPIIKSTSFSIH